MSESEQNKVIAVERPRIPLFPRLRDGESWNTHITKEADKEEAASNQGVETGRKEHPFNMAATGKLLTADTHHSASIAAKIGASVGLGIKDENAEEILDDLCTVSWQSLIIEVAEDFENTGNGYIEVVRQGGEITGLHHLRASGVWLHLDDVAQMDWHYEIFSQEGQERRFARFGDGDRLKGTLVGAAKQLVEGQAGTFSEVIHIKDPSSLSRWYGVPRWLSAVAAIELVMSILQHNYDFFNNRGVPEFILFVLGQKVIDEDWKQIENKIQEHVGLGNGYKSMAINFPGEAQVQLEKLGIDTSEEGSFDKMLDTLSMRIVSAHQVPPQLAGIMIPGKLGATNELPNAMAVFQAMVISQKQKLWTSVLGCTLGKEGLGIPGVTRKSFEWNTIVEKIDLPGLDAVARTRKPAAEGVAPAGQGPQGGKRAPEAGTPAARLANIAAEDLSSEERVSLLVELYKAAMDRLLSPAA